MKRGPCAPAGVWGPFFAASRAGSCSCLELVIRSEAGKGTVVSMAIPLGGARGGVMEIGHVLWPIGSYMGSFIEIAGDFTGWLFGRNGRFWGCLAPIASDFTGYFRRGMLNGGNKPFYRGYFRRRARRGDQTGCFDRLATNCSNEIGVDGRDQFQNRLGVGLNFLLGVMLQALRQEMFAAQGRFPFAANQPQPPAQHRSAPKKGITGRPYSRLGMPFCLAGALTRVR